ncbi:hypothetical protein LWI28_024766 [Acer negundo]|uniref:Uncharacterized protein n=1 Tax=Acer negundo TaxID=4023 RepID=A0AAD5NY90_ACENE|nr:hypothetical protein LWI28_024766 [Acer negundo]
MVPATSVVVFLPSLWLLFFINNLDFAISREVSKNKDQLLPTPTIVCVDCSICPYTCQKLTPPPSGYPLYGAPPPPKAKENCPPVPPVQACCGRAWW